MTGIMVLSIRDLAYSRGPALGRGDWYANSLWELTSVINHLCHQRQALDIGCDGPPFPTIGT